MKQQSAITIRRLLAVCAVLLVCCVARATVTLDSSNFPDAAFRAKLCAIFSASEGDEIDPTSVTLLNLANGDNPAEANRITILTGIEHFTSVTEVWLDNNSLTAVPAVPASCVKLSIKNNRLTSISIPASATRLRYVWYNGNNTLPEDMVVDGGMQDVVGINLSGTNIMRLTVKNTNLYSLYVCDNPSLEELYVKYNPNIKSLSTAGRLQKYCSDNGTEDGDPDSGWSGLQCFSGLPKLKKLDLSGTVDAPNTALTAIEDGSLTDLGSLEDINLSYCTNLAGTIDLRPREPLPENFDCNPVATEENPEPEDPELNLPPSVSRSLKHLNLTGCTSIGTLNVEDCLRLYDLNMSYCGLDNDNYGTKLRHNVRTTQKNGVDGLAYQKTINLNHNNFSAVPLTPLRYDRLFIDYNRLEGINVQTDKVTLHFQYLIFLSARGPQNYPKELRVNQCGNLRNMDLANSGSTLKTLRVRGDELRSLNLLQIEDGSDNPTVGMTELEIYKCRDLEWISARETLTEYDYTETLYDEVLPDGHTIVHGNGLMIKNLSSLKKLTVTGVEEPYMNSLVKIEEGAFNGCNNLEEVNILYCGELRSSIDFSTCTGPGEEAEDYSTHLFPELRKVNVSGCKKIQNLNVQNCRKLYEVNMSDCALTDENWLTKFQTNKYTAKANNIGPAWGKTTIFNDNFLTHIPPFRLNQWNKLYIENNLLTDIQVPSLNTNLKTIFAGGTQDFGESLTLTAAKLNNVDGLSLTNHGSTLKTFAITGATTLQTLDLRKTETTAEVGLETVTLTDTGIKAITTNTTVPNFSSNQDYTGNGLMAYNLNTLKTLDISGTEATPNTVFESVDRHALQYCTALENLCFNNDSKFTTFKIVTTSEEADKDFFQLRRLEVRNTPLTALNLSERFLNTTTTPTTGKFELLDVRGCNKLWLLTLDGNFLTNSNFVGESNKSDRNFLFDDFTGSEASPDPDDVTDVRGISDTRFGKQIHYSNNGFTDVPAIPKFCTSAFVEGCPLGSVAVNEGATGLKYLSVENSSFTTYEVTIDKLQGVKCLNIANTGPKLKTIDIRHNRDLFTVYTKTTDTPALLLLRAYDNPLLQSVGTDDLGIDEVLGIEAENGLQPKGLQAGTLSTLKTLDLQFSNFESIDGSLLPSTLETLELNCNFNLRSIDVETLTSLNHFCVRNCNLGALDVSKNTSLVKFDCSNWGTYHHWAMPVINAYLAEQHMEAIPADQFDPATSHTATRLNQISDLVIKSDNIQEVHAGYNHMYTLKLDCDHSKLLQMDCSNNHINALDLTGAESLTLFDDSNNGRSVTAHNAIFGFNGSYANDNWDYVFFFQLDPDDENTAFLGTHSSYDSWRGDYRKSLVHDGFDVTQSAWGADDSGASAVVEMPRRAAGTTDHLGGTGVTGRVTVLTPTAGTYNRTTGAASGRATYTYDTGAKMADNSTHTSTYYLDWAVEKNLFTGVEDVQADGDVVSVTYYNATGVSSDRPFEGLNIAVITRADGTVTTTKILK